MTKFAFIVHPITARDAARKYPWAKVLPERVIEAIMAKKKPIFVSEIKGIRSITGKETEGVFIGCPLTTRLMNGGMPVEKAYQKITDCIALAAEHGAQVVGLGAFTAVVGDAGVTIAKRSPIAVTTGNSYTVTAAIQAVEEACRRLDVDMAEATLAVVGATGSIGKAAAVILSPKFRRTFVVGRDQERTQAVANQLPRAIASVDVNDVKQADVVVTVTSAGASIIGPEHLMPGAIVCDVSRPRDVSVKVAQERPDVLVIEGGVIEVPGPVDFGFDFGFPPKTAYACMSETMLLALEDRPEGYTLGKDVSVEQVEEMAELAQKHGFKLSGFRSFEKAVDDATIERVKNHRQKAVTSAR